MNCTAFPPKLDSVNEDGFFDWQRTWNSKAVEAALRDGLDPDILWTKKNLVSTRGVSHEDAWTHWNTPLHLAIRASDHDSAVRILRTAAISISITTEGTQPFMKPLTTGKKMVFGSLYGTVQTQTTLHGMATCLFTWLSATETRSCFSTYSSTAHHCRLLHSRSGQSQILRCWLQKEGY